MEVQKILELTGKGFTPDQITQLQEYNLEDVNALLEGGQTTEGVMSLLPMLDKNNVAKVSNIDVNNDNEDVKPKDDVKALTEELAKLKASIQANNLKNASQPKSEVKSENVDDIISSFFNTQPNGGK